MRRTGRGSGSTKGASVEARSRVGCGPVGWDWLVGIAMWSCMACWAKVQAGELRRVKAEAC